MRTDITGWLGDALNRWTVRMNAHPTLDIFGVALNPFGDLTGVFVGVEPAEGLGDFAVLVQCPLFPARNFAEIAGFGVFAFQCPRKDRVVAGDAEVVHVQDQGGEFGVKARGHFSDCGAADKGGGVVDGDPAIARKERGDAFG